MNYVASILSVFVLLNLWTMLRFWQDKMRAIEGGRRIAEANLLWLAMLGGTPGALLARHLFRHKTRKQPFSSHLQTIGIVQLGLGIGLIIGLAVLWPMRYS